MKRLYGFNFQWMYTSDRALREADEQALDFMQAHGLNFVRLPTDYRFWTRGTGYFEPDKGILERIRTYFRACERRGIHFSLNLHRAPGYCINYNQLETHNLWVDQVARDAFLFIWETFARMFRGVPGEVISFDLLNEPPGIGEYGLSRENHKELMVRVREAIGAIDPKRVVIIDGLAGGNLAMPELAELAAVQSTRGYQPMALTHYRAAWCAATAEVEEAFYPGVSWEGQTWDRQTLAGHYRPWRELEEQGVAVHVGECGCYNTVSNADALRWFDDLFSLYREWGWGYALWNFHGPFGIAEHGRPGTKYTEYNGYRIDKDLLELYLAGRVDA